MQFLTEKILRHEAENGQSESKSGEFGTEIGGGVVPQELLLGEGGSRVARVGEGGSPPTSP